MNLVIDDLIAAKEKFKKTMGQTTQAIICNNKLELKIKSEIEEFVVAYTKHPELGSHLMVCGIRVFVLPQLKDDEVLAFKDEKMARDIVGTVEFISRTGGDARAFLDAIMKMIAGGNEGRNSDSRKSGPSLG